MSSDRTREDGTIESREQTDWDAPGVLSIVVQGGLFQGNLVETANHCRHWRALFPRAEIVLSVSTTDVVTSPVAGGIFASVDLIPKHRDDGLLRAALNLIMANCDKVVLADSALPLPPIKIDLPRPNNMNLQIAAAKRGLGVAAGTYVLRVRSDLIFLDRSFLDQYGAGDRLPRGKTSVFKRRILISWLYTLNPFTVERLPMHFSDWFNFGLTSDVRQLWAAPFISLDDALYYRTHPHSPGSNARERLFNVRLAVEQHLNFACFKEHLPDLQLALHNDPSSAELSLDILVDNFVLCDLVRAQCVFDKYVGEFTDHAKRFHCITPEDWRAMALNRDVPHRTTLADKIKEATDEKVFQRDQSFPRNYAANRLRTRDGRLINGEIVAVATDGVLFFGPYVSIPGGRYRASIATTTLEGSGTLILRVTAEAGNVVLAETKVKVDPARQPDLSIPFDVPEPGVSRFEVVCGMDDVRGVAVSGIIIEQRTGSALPAPRKSRLRRLLRK